MSRVTTHIHTHILLLAAILLFSLTVNLDSGGVPHSDTIHVCQDLSPLLSSRVGGTGCTFCRSRAACYHPHPRYQSINQSIIKTNLHTEVTSGLQKKNAKVTKTTVTIKLKIKKLKSLAKHKSFQVTFKSFCVRNLLQRRWQSVPCSWCGIGKGPLTEFQSRTWLFIS